MSASVAILEPAPLLAARELFAASAGVKPLLGRAAALQLAAGRTFGLAVDGALLVVMGVWAHDDGTAELFMVCAAAERVRPHVVPLVAAGRLIVRKLRQDATIGRLVARVAPGARPSGRRLARAVGFDLSQRTAPPGPFLELELP